MEWGVLAIDMWIDKKSVHETFSAIADSVRDNVNNSTDMTVVIGSINDASPYPDFNDMLTMIEGVEGALDIRQYQAYLIDFVTNNWFKYGSVKMTLDSWIPIWNYLNATTRKAMTLPAPVVFDGFNARTKKSVGANENSMTSLIFTGIGVTNRQMLILNSDQWQFYMYQDMVVKAMHCVNLGREQDCNDIHSQFAKIIKDPKLNQYLRGMQQEAHIDIDSPYFNYPMIPFCWFGEPLRWLGKHRANFTSVQDDLADPSKILRWCDVFQKTFPIRSNCFSIDGVVAKGGKSLVIIKINSSTTLYYRARR